MRSKNKAMHLFSLSCGSTKSTTMRKRKGRGNDRVRGRCCGPGSPDALPGCVRFRFCLWRKYLLKICSRYSTRAVPAAADEGRGEGEAQQQQPHKLAQNLQMPQKKKKKRRNQAKRRAASDSSDVTATSTSALAAAPA